MRVPGGCKQAPIRFRYQTNYVCRSDDLYSRRFLEILRHWITTCQHIAVWGGCVSINFIQNAPIDYWLRWKIRWLVLQGVFGYFSIANSWFLVWKGDKRQIMQESTLSIDATVKPTCLHIVLFTWTGSIARVSNNNEPCNEMTTMLMRVLIFTG